MSRVARRIGAILCGALWLPASAAAGQSWPAELLSDLPAGANVFAVLETTQAEVVTDRFNSGGLNAGEPSRAGGWLASWRQTRYRLGDVNLSSAVDGTPLLFPEIAWWQTVDIATRMFPSDLNASSLAVSMDPRRPTPAWSGQIEGSISRGGLAARGPTHGAPPIARLRDWAHASAVISGPVVGDRLGVVLGTAWSRNHVVRRGETQRAGELGSAFALALFTPRPGDEIRATAFTQRGSGDHATHVQSAFERRRQAGAIWRIFGAFTQRVRSAEPLASGIVVDRLTRGPVSSIVADRDGTERQWSMGARMSSSRRRGRHALRAGADVMRAAVREAPAFSGLIGETLDGLPARVWSYAPMAADSRRHALTFAAFAADRIDWSPRLSLELGLRFEHVTGAAAGAIQGITWQTLLPTASLRWNLGTPLALSLVTGIQRSADHLLLDLLTVGDPASPAANVHRWDAAVDTSGPVVLRVGPGGGDATFSVIDTQLQRPRTDTFVIGLESTPRRALTLGVTGVARRQSQQIALVNAGVPPSTYRQFTVPDANADLVKPDDDHDLVVYERAIATFGQDRYVLSNPSPPAASMGAVTVSAQASTPRLFLSVAATAAAAVGAGASRGFRAVENDRDALGELFVNPNAATNARGRLFNDRAYTIKWATVYRFPRDVRIGVIARYQDGQPFSRMVIVPGLNQGAEAVQAFANGRSRFAFTGTLDLRLQKRLRRGHAGVDVILDVYNLPNMRKETEEYVVTGPRFRTTTAVQPPRTVHLGMRVAF